jgi:hypothetical protein
MKTNMIALMAVACCAAPSMAGHIGGYGNGLSVASIDSVATNGYTKHAASVKHVVELPKQVVPVAVHPVHHATVQHDVVHQQTFPVHHDTFNKGYGAYNTHFDTFNKGYGSYNTHFDTFNKGYGNVNTFHHTSFPVTKTITTFPVNTVVSSYPTYNKFHY